MKASLTIVALSLLPAWILAAPGDPPRGIAQALTCGKVGEAEGVSPGKDLHRIDLNLAKYPNAVCNDGTPAAMFVRR